MGDLDSKMSALSEKVHLQQGQINTLFKFFEELKDSVKSIAQDLKSIRSDIHDAIATKIETEHLITDLSATKQDVKELTTWKNQVFGVIIFIGCLLPIVDIALRYVGK